MNLSAQTKVSFLRELVFCTYRDHLPEISTFLPNISSIRAQKREDDGPRTHLVNHWTAKAEIPLLMKKLMKIDQLTWTDVSSWDQTDWICRWKIKTDAFPDLVDCSGTTSFLESGTGTEIRIAGDLTLNLEKAHVPRMLASSLRPVVEKLVINGLTPNLLSTGEGVERFLISKNKAVAGASR